VVVPPVGATAGQAYDPGTPRLTDLWVDPNRGDDEANDGTCRARAFRTLHRAWMAIPADERLTRTGYRIRLGPGRYEEDETYLDRRYGTYECPVIVEAADAPGTAVIGRDLHFFSCNYIYVQGLRTEPDNGGDGLHFDACEFVLIRDCVIKAGPGDRRCGSEGLKVNQSAGVYVERCEIANGNNTALDFVATQGGHVRGCRLHDAGDWVAYVKGGSSDLLFEGNELYRGGGGGFTAGQGTGSQYLVAPSLTYEATAIRFVNNYVHDCEGAGLGVNGGKNILLAHNTLYRVGRRSHGIEVTFGRRSLDGTADQNIADTFLAWGGWTQNRSGGEQWIPCRDVYIYNNILHNPVGYRSEWRHLELTGPYRENTNPRIPRPATVDENLRICGNVFWNGAPDLELGVGEGTAGAADNPTCHAAQLVADNAINRIEPQWRDAAAGDFRLLADCAVSELQPVPVPPFPGEATSPLPARLPQVGTCHDQKIRLYLK